MISFKTGYRNFLLGVCILLPSVFLYSQIYISENTIVVQTENRSIVYIEKNKSDVESEDKLSTEKLDDNVLYISKEALVTNANLLITKVSTESHTIDIQKIKNYKKEENSSVVSKKRKERKYINSNLHRSIFLVSKSTNDNNTTFNKFSKNDYTITNNFSRKILRTVSFDFEIIANGFTDKILFRIGNQCYINNQYFLNKYCIRPPSFISPYI